MWHRMEAENGGDDEGWTFTEYYLQQQRAERKSRANYIYCEKD